MKNNKPLRVACYMRVGTKEQIDHCKEEESITTSQEEAPEVSDEEEESNEHLVQQTMEIAY